MIYPNGRMICNCKLHCEDDDLLGQADTRGQPCRRRRLLFSVDLHCVPIVHPAECRRSLSQMTGSCSGKEMQRSRVTSA